MKIYGVAILAGCFLVGQFLGLLLGDVLGTGRNVGGVGFAMAILIFLGDFLRNKGYLPELTSRGIAFWSAMYIPVIIAMAATTNVRKALEGGWLAVVAGVLGTALCLLLVKVMVGFVKEADIESPIDPET
ncbi:MAG: malonate transporter subunit MadL [Saprospiraceae bacterium]